MRIAILTHGSRAYVPSLVEILLVQGISASDITVFWNKCNSRTAKRFATRAEAAGCLVRRSSENIPVGAAYNRMLSDGPLDIPTLRLDDDCIPLPGAIATIASFSQRVRAAVVGGGLLNEDGSIQSNGGICTKHKAWPVELETVRSRRVYYPWVSGAAMLLMPQALQSLMFNEDYPIWFEDIDYCFQAWEYGLRVAMCKQSKFIHMSKGLSVDDPQIKRSLRIFMQRWSHHSEIRMPCENDQVRRAVNDFRSG